MTGALATILDHQMLEKVKGIRIVPGLTPDDQLDKKKGGNVAEELGGRYLVRYMLAHQVGRYTSGSVDRHWVTPTAYGDEEVISWLALPAPRHKRNYVLLLDPTEIDEIWGPRWVHMGGGIEYILPRGFPQKALIFPWELRLS